MSKLTFSIVPILGGCLARTSGNTLARHRAKEIGWTAGRFVTDAEPTTSITHYWSRHFREHVS